MPCGIERIGEVGGGVNEMYVVKSGAGYVLDAETLEMTTSLDDALIFEDQEAAAAVANELTDMGRSADWLEI